MSVEPKDVVPPKTKLPASGIVEHPTKELTEFMLADLAKSGLTPDDIESKLDSQRGGYGFPYYDLDGNPHTKMYRVRLLKVVDGQRYDQPSKDKIGDAACIPYIHPSVWNIEADRLLICEGEKKTRAAIKFLGYPAIGIGGKDSWGGIALDWILEVVRRRQPKQIDVVPDGDIVRYDIARSYGQFVTSLRARLKKEGIECTVRLTHPPGKLDDLLVEWGPEAGERYDALPEFQEIVENLGELARTYGLSCTLGEKGNVKDVPANESNLGRLLAKHPLMPKVWRNLDTLAVHFDDGATQEDFHPVGLLHFFQHNLGLKNTKLQTLKTAIGYEARLNSRSPLRGWLNGLVWDGVPRLETMLIDYCGAEDTPFVREVGSKWLVGAVARKLEPGCIVDYMLIPKGAQGIGKTSFFDVVFGQDQVATVLGSDKNHRDRQLLYHSGWLINFDELDAMDGGQKEHLKADCTAKKDSFRAPYGRGIEAYLRESIWGGTTNKAAPLGYDASGNRRSCVVEFHGMVKFASLERDRDQLFAEAVSKFRAGEPYSNVDLADAEAQKHVRKPEYIDRFEETDWDEFLRGNKLGPRTHHLVDGYVWLKMDDVKALAGLGEFAKTFEKDDLRNHLVAKGWVFKDKDHKWGRDPRVPDKRKQLYNVFIKRRDELE